MSPQGSERAWTAGSVAGVLGLVMFAFAVGFIVIPVVQGRQAGIDPWTAFCRALGIEAGTPAVRQPVSTAQAQPVSQVAWTPELLDELSAANWHEGEKLSQQLCVACHGPRGLSPDPQYPHLSGQSASAIFKQLHDYRSGARRHPLMTGIAQGLQEEQMRAVAAFFARGNSFASLGNVEPLDDYEMDRLANRGRPDRGIPACNGCHGRGVGGPIETPSLDGQRREYLEAQLRMYAARERRNDVYGRMRTIASRLTDQEIRDIAEHYAGLPAPVR